MRISRGALLVAIAFTVPFAVELRTILVWVDIEITLLESIALGAAMALAIVAYALWPEPDGDPEPSGSR